MESQNTSENVTIFADLEITTNKTNFFNLKNNSIYVKNKNHEKNVVSTNFISFIKNITIKLNQKTNFTKKIIKNQRILNTELHNSLLDDYDNRLLNNYKMFDHNSLNTFERTQNQLNNYENNLIDSNLFNQFDLINNSIENDDFYFTFTTTTEKENISPSVTEPPVDSEFGLVNYTKEDHVQLTTPVIQVNINQTIPYNIPFQFNYSIINNETINKVNILTTLEDNETTKNIEDYSPFTYDSIDQMDSTTVNVQIITQNESTAYKTDITDNTLTNFMSTNSISLNIQTTADISIDLNTTKSTPFPGYLIKKKIRLLYYLNFIC